MRKVKATLDASGKRPSNGGVAQMDRARGL